MAYAMVTVYGMNERLGNISFADPQNEYNFQKPYSDETARLIDEEVRGFIEQAYVRTKKLLTERREQLEQLAQALLKREVLFQSDLTNLLGRRPYDSPPAIELVDENERPIPSAAPQGEVSPSPNAPDVLPPISLA